MSPPSVEGRAERSPPGADLSSSGARPLRSTPSHEPGNAHAADPIGGMRVCACTQQIPLRGRRDLRGARSLIHEQTARDFFRECVYYMITWKAKQKSESKGPTKGGESISEKREERKVSEGKRKEKRWEQIGEGE